MIKRQPSPENKKSNSYAKRLNQLKKNLGQAVSKRLLEGYIFNCCIKFNWKSCLNSSFRLKVLVGNKDNLSDRTREQRYIP